jgi:hypothetical protein
MSPESREGGHVSSWVLVPAAESLRAEIDTIAPERDKTTDGSIGDTAHQGNPSDHNLDESGNTPDEDSDKVDEVHAIDVDKDLNLPDVTMQDVVDTLVERCRRDNSDPKNEARLKYIIFNGYIWDAPGWQKVKYTGSNPHDKHAHFSFEYDSQYSESTAPWGLIEKYGSEDEMAFLPEYGDTGEEVKFWQFLHNDMGYSVGAVDGHYGDATQAAFDKYRKAFGEGTGVKYVSGWHAWHILRGQAQKYAGKPGAPGAPGKDGQPGKDGADGTISGTYVVTGGEITMEGK